MRQLPARVLFVLLSCLSVTSWASPAEDLAKTRMAAEKGNALAQFFMGLHYHEGFGGISKDYSEAVTWWKKSADQSFPDAEEALADAYYLGEGIGQDYTEALRWFKRAVLHGSTMSCLRVSTIYMKGQGVPQDLLLSHAWLSVYEPNDEPKRAIQRKLLAILELKLSQQQLQKSREIAGDLRRDIRANTK
jgi:TPR repeat protein